MSDAKRLKKKTPARKGFDAFIWVFGVLLGILTVTSQTTAQAQGLEIEASGEGPELTDLPSGGVQWEGLPRQASSRQFAESILSSMSDVDLILSLPPQNLEKAYEGLLPFKEEDEGLEF
jgi:hypothetical protein